MNSDNPIPEKQSDEICLWNTWWNVQRSIRYHSYRQAFFEGYSRLVAGLNIVLSSAAGASLMKTVEKSDTGFATGLLILLALINTFDLVYGFSKRAWHHRELRNKFIEIEKRFLAGRRHDVVPKGELNKIEEEILSIEVDEPPIYRNLDIFCYNEMVKAYYPKEDQPNRITEQKWYQKFSRNFIRTLG